MLQSLHIENMAVIRRIDVDFSEGFTVITGETGAGKSVMIDSLKLLLGAKAEKEMIRHGASEAEVSALFYVSSSALISSLDSLGISPDEEGCLAMSRRIREDGKSISRINGKTVSLAILRDAMQYLLHIHGQDDTSFLKQAGSELQILDAAAHNEAEKTAYLSLYRKLLEARRTVERLTMDASEKARTIELLRYQIDDIEAVSPEAGEEDRLFDEKIKLKNIEKIAKQTSFAYRALRGAEKGNACYILDRAVAALRAVEGVVADAGTLADALEEHLSDIEDVAERVKGLTDFEGEDPSLTLDRVEERMAAIAALTRKYGGSETAVLAFLSEAREKLATLEAMEEDHSKAQKEYERLYGETLAAAERLSETRRRAAEGIQAEIADMLHALDMPNAVFRVDLTRREGNTTFHENGYEDACFMITVNKGEPFVSVSKCASGGETSRIMLAIKSVIARHDGMPTLIFDEVDSGVSGKTSRKIGYTFKKSALGTQILCITHSAQIASLADEHLLVSKGEKEGRTETCVRSLAYEERVEELARILGGIHVTESQRMAARDMLSGTEA